MQHAEHLLRREIAVGDQSKEKWRDDGRYRIHRVGPVGQRSIPWFDMYTAIVVYHAPQMKNCRNIITDSFVRITRSLAP